MLFERKEIYKLVVGPAQEIVSSNFKKSLEKTVGNLDMEELVKGVQADIEKVKNRIKEREEISEGLSYKKIEKIQDDNKVIHLVEEFLKVTCKSFAIPFRIENLSGRRYFHLDLPSEYKDLEQWNNASLDVGNPNTLTPAHPIVNVLAKEVAKRGTSQKGSDMSVYIIKQYDGLADLMVKGVDGTIVMDRKSGDETLEIFDRLLTAAKT
jgi:hypothetical protein